MSKKGPLTLRELGQHLTREAIRASAQMELDQRDLWRDLIRTHSDLQESAGMGVPQYLGVDEMSFALHLVPYKESWFRRLWRGKPRFGDQPAYRFVNKPAKENPITFTITVTR